MQSPHLSRDIRRPSWRFVASQSITGKRRQLAGPARDAGQVTHSRINAEPSLLYPRITPPAVRDEVDRVTQIYSGAPIMETRGARPTQPLSGPLAAGR
jgi:hypothetical protein